MMKSLIVLVCMGCSSTAATLHNTTFASSDQVWVIQKEDGQYDSIIYCNKEMRPTVCFRAWNGSSSGKLDTPALEPRPRSFEIERTLP